MTCTSTTARVTAFLAGAALIAPAAAAADSHLTGGAAFGSEPEATASRTVELSGGERLLAGSDQRVTFTITAGVEAVEAVRVEDDDVVRRWSAEDADSDGVIRWDGTVRGQPVETGQYAFRVADAAASAGAARAAQRSTTEAFDVIDATFPIRGRFEIGTAFTNGFGGGRGHQGQDVFAKCGTPLVAARPGRVMRATSQAGAAGNYVVLQDAKGSSYAYMHMRDKALVDDGDRVRAGEVIGYVGDTGRASGCHLHFERWTAPGWYAGGEAYDALPELKRWAAWTKAPGERSRGRARAHRH